MNSRISLFAGLVAASLSLKGAEPAPRPDITAETHDHDLQTGITVLKQAVITYGDAVLRGDEIQYDTRSNVAVAKGHVTLVQQEKRVIADEITYYFKDGVFKLVNPKIGAFPMYLVGSSAEGDRNDIRVKDARLTYGEPGPWTPALRTESLAYHRADGTFSSSTARLGVGAIEPLPLPAFERSLGASFSASTTLQGGYRSSLGFFLDAGVRVPVASGISPGLDLGYFTKRGLLVGPGLAYDRILGPDSRIKGSLRTGYINDVGDRGVDILGRSVPEQRSFIEWDHQQTILPGLTLDGTLNDWRDSEVMRDFRRREFWRNQAPDTYLEANYATGNHQLSLFTRYRVNDFHGMQERLPELRYDLLPSPLLFGVYQRANASYVRLRERELGSSEIALQSDRVDGYYGLTRNFSPREWFGATAVAGGRATYYDNTKPKTGDGARARYLGELGFDTHLQSSGTFDYKNERWGIDGLRHLVKPFVSYRYIPEKQDGTGTIPEIDRETFTTYLQPLGLGDARHVDTLHRTNTARFGLENTLQTRDAQYGSRDLASLILAQDYHFQPEPGSPYHSDLNAALSLSPARWVSFDLYTSIDPRGAGVRELNTGLTLRDGQEWMFRLSTHHLRNDLTEYVSYFEKRLNEQYSAYLKFNYDQHNSRITEQSYGLMHNLSNLWLFRYEVSFFDGSRREGDFELRLAVDARIF